MRVEKLHEQEEKMNENCGTLISHSGADEGS
jgi:hypothetical protein